MTQGSGALHTAAERYVQNGLQPDGDDRLLVVPPPDESPDTVGPDASSSSSLADTLRNPGSDQFHVVVQLRSTPEAPMEIWAVTGQNAFEWAAEDTLRGTVEVRPWGGFDRIDDPAERERLASATELVFTGVWTLEPELDTLPETVELGLG